MDYLTSILARKRAEIAELGPRSARLMALAGDRPPARPWASGLRRSDRVTLIAELKRRSPSSGALRPDLDPAALARVYARAGAAALSVLTDGDFDGRLADLEAARDSVALPVLRKDFVLHPAQVWESRAAGADAVLLIVRALSGQQLADLLGTAGEAGLGTLVEAHDEEELDRALEAGSEVIGINNRDLASFATDPSLTLDLASRVGPGPVLVAESGIESPDQVRELGARGIDAVLVGRALVTHADPGRLAGSLASQPKEARR